MRYLAVKSFTDAQDNGYKYHVGDTYPHDGYKPTAERIEELATDKNRRRCPMIKAVKDEAVEAEKVETVKEETPKAEKKATVKKVDKPQKGNTKPRKKTDVK